MSTIAPCPKCGQQTLRRSKSKSRLELFIKKIKPVNPCRIYKCRHCGWRGWMSKVKANGQLRIVWKSVFFYISAGLFVFIIALWVMHSVHNN